MKKLLKNSLMAGAILAALVMGGGLAKCQPYYTNSAPQAGAYQYNQNWAQPLQPSVTLSKQDQAGILAGAITPAPWFLLTNSFATNIYTTAPVITANGSGSGSQSVCATNVVTVVSASTTNFVLQCAVTNQTIYWEAIGH
jgi:hypothetical protein